MKLPASKASKVRRVLRSRPTALGLRDAWARLRVRTSRGPVPRVTLSALHREFGGTPSAHTVDVDCIVFSKDRPMQLDACLRSIVRHAPYRGSITVIYRATTERFRQGYAQLDPDPRVRLVEQGRDFRIDVVDVLREAGELIVFHTDDDLFFRTPPRAPLLPQGCSAFSLRLGENTTYCYPLARDQSIPRCLRLDGVKVWEWDHAELDFAYPMSLDGHVFEAELIRALVRDAAFSDPNEFERELHLRRHRASRLMLSFEHSCVVAVPVNVVTESIVNRSGADPQLSPEALNERFLEGVRIDLDAIDFTNVRAAHQEIALAFSNASGTHWE